MPFVTTFYGIIITMNFNEHNPPHFHARYGDYKARFDFSGELVDGEMPKSKIALIKAWAILHKEELEANWILAASKETIVRIEPLK